MFIFTAKFNKKKAIAAVLILAAILIAIILLAGGGDKTKDNANASETAALSAVVKNNEQRVNYLKALGWEVEQNVLEQQKIVIPREFTEVYKNYNEIQQEQGFDLSKYGGAEAMRYTYRILNYPGATGTVVADIIVHKNEVIAGDVQSNALDGFMAGLEFPKEDAPEGADTQTLAADTDTETADELTAEEVLTENTGDSAAQNEVPAAAEAAEEDPAE
jgi:hypothetical protein